MTMQMKIQSEREDAAIEATVKTSQRYKVSDDEIIENLMLDFDLTKDEAKEKLFWHDQEEANWEMKMNEPIAIKKLTDEEAQKFLPERSRKRSSSGNAQKV